MRGCHSLTVATGLLAVSTSFAAVDAAERPNILFIMWDDAGLGDNSAYPNSMTKPRLLTPSAQKLADEGMLFNSGFTGAPVCAPSRSTLWTGIHTGHMANTALNNNTVSMAHVMSAAGYEVAITGKWGLSDDNPKPSHYHGNYTPPKNAGDPYLQGFGVVTNAVFNQWTCHDYYNYFAWQGDKVVPVEANANASVANCGEDHDLCYWAGDMFADAAEAYLQDKGSQMREARESGSETKPWMLYVSFTSPHAGSVGSVEETDVPAPRVSQWPYKQRGQQDGWPKVEVDFATAISETDNRTGSILAELSRQGLDDSTLVVLASDNGAHNEGGHVYTFFNSSSYLNGFKRSIHDGGIRSQGVFRWPGKIAPGSVSDQQFAFYDFLPTFAELAGAPASAMPKHVDGHSFARVLTSPGTQPTQPPFLYHQFGSPQDPGFCSGPEPLYPHGCAWGQAVHVGNMSAVCLYPRSSSDEADAPAPGVGHSEVALFGNLGLAGAPQPPCADVLVYNLTVDAGQTTNIAASEKDFVAIAKELFVSQFAPSEW